MSWLLFPYHVSLQATTLAELTTRGCCSMSIRSTVVVYTLNIWIYHIYVAAHCVWIVNPVFQTPWASEPTASVRCCMINKLPSCNTAQHFKILVYHWLSLVVFKNKRKCSTVMAYLLACFSCYTMVEIDPFKIQRVLVRPLGPLIQNCMNVCFKIKLLQ